MVRSGQSSPDHASPPSERRDDPLYQSIVESLNQGIYVADACNRITYGNPAMFALGGFLPQDLIGSNSFRHVAREDRAAVMRKIRDWAADRDVQAATCEFRVVTRDGRKFWVEQSTHFIRDPDGRVIEARNSVRDISERRANEAALRTSEQRFRDLVENIGQGFYIADANSLFRYCNPAMSQVSGFDVSELRGTSLLRLVAAEDRQRVLAQFVRWAAGRDLATAMEYRLETKAGAKIWIEQVTQIVRHANGAVHEFRCFLTDISQRKQAEIVLRESERQFRGVFDESPIPIILLDVESGEIREVNKAATDIFGYTREEAMGKTTSDLSIWPDPAERDQLNQILRERGSVHGWETVMCGRDRRLIHVIFNASQLMLRGQLCVLASVIDITDRKRAEQLFHDLFAFSPDAYLIATSEGIITDVNERALTLFGYRRDELVGQSWEKLTPDAARSQMAERLKRYLANPVVHPMGNSAPGLVARHRNGREFPIDISLSPLQSGGETRVVAAVRDITVQMQTADELRRSEAQLRQAQKMESLGTLAGGIAHDFNNILTGILGYAQLAAGDLAGDHPAQPWMQGIVKSGVRAKQLVDQILTFSRKTESTRTPTRLQQVVVETLSLLRSTLPAMVELVPQVDPQCPPALADGTQIHQIILNLCTNAWHALPENGGRITVSLRPRFVSAEEASRLPPLRGGAHLVLSVEDNGRGMAATTLERIFEPFFTTKDAGKGTGLGLAVVHSIVTAHGGAITVESTPGQGTRFDLYLPALESKAPVVGTLPPMPLPGGRGERILVVDDEIASGTVIARLLGRIGYEVDYCNDPQEALTRLAAGEHTLLVTDLAMPGIPGDELTRRALKQNPSLSVLMLSGFIEPGKIDSLRAAGVREILGKPPVYAELAAAVERCLAG